MGLGVQYLSPMRINTGIPALPAALKAESLNCTLKMVQGHHSVSTRQAQTLTHTMERLSDNEQEWRRHLERGQELQEERARLMSSLGLTMTGLWTVLGHMGDVMRQD